MMFFWEVHWEEKKKEATTHDWLPRRLNMMAKHLCAITIPERHGTLQCRNQSSPHKSSSASCVLRDEQLCCSGLTWAGAGWEPSRRSTSQSSQQRDSAQQASSQQVARGSRHCRWPARAAYVAASLLPPARMPLALRASEAFSAACSPHTPPSVSSPEYLNTDSNGPEVTQCSNHC